MNTKAQELILPTHVEERARQYIPPAVANDGTMLMQIVDRALREPNFDMGKIQQMLELKARWDAMEAKKAYTADMAEFKKNPPVIYKNKHVGFNLKTGGRTDYDHATHDEVTLKVVAGLSQHGFSHKWVPTQHDGLVRVTCIITHRLGHEESIFLEAPPDTSGSKSAVQAILSTKTLLERHLLLAITGLTAADMPDADDRRDENNEELQYIGEGQIANIEALLTETNSSMESFLRVIKADSLSRIHVTSYDMVIGLLEAKRKHV